MPFFHEIPFLQLQAQDPLISQMIKWSLVAGFTGLH